MPFENKDFEGIYYSRFVASWFRSGGPHKHHLFRHWLETLTINEKRIPDDVIREIMFLFDNGKLELQTHAKMYLRDMGVK